MKREASSGFRRVLSHCLASIATLGLLVPVWHCAPGARYELFTEQRGQVYIRGRVSDDSGNGVEGCLVSLNKKSGYRLSSHCAVISNHDGDYEIPVGPDCFGSKSKIRDGEWFVCADVRHSRDADRFDIFEWLHSANCEPLDAMTLFEQGEVSHTFVFKLSPLYRLTKQRDDEERQRQEAIRRVRQMRDNEVRWVSVMRANMRDAPTLEGRVVNTLWRGAIAYAKEISGDWVRVQLPASRRDSRDEGDVSEANIPLWGPDPPGEDADHNTFLIEKPSVRKGWIHGSLLIDTEVEEVSLWEQRRHEARVRRQAAIEGHPEWPGPMKEKILAGRIRRGMTPEMVRAAWGAPGDINRTVGAWGVHEQWVYGEIGHSQYLYFENGVLTSWQD